MATKPGCSNSCCYPLSVGLEAGDTPRLQTSSASECWCYTTKNCNALPKLGTSDITPIFYIALLLKCNLIFDAYLKRLLHPVCHHLQRNNQVLTVNDLPKKKKKKSLLYQGVILR